LDVRGADLSHAESEEEPAMGTSSHTLGDLFSARTQVLASRRIRLLLIFCTLLLSFSMSTPTRSAGPAFLVYDISPGVASSVPSRLTAVDDTLFFVADDGSHGRELWKSDGTPQGTVLVKDIYPGVGNAFDLLAGRIVFLSAVIPANHLLFFVATDGSSGFELWKSDGTPEGTVLVKDINPGAGSAAPGNLTTANGTLFFHADDGSHGGELWRSDGTPDGTQLVEDLIPGQAGSSPHELVDFGGTLFFLAYRRPDIGEELWKSDGTPAGTVFVKDIIPGAETPSVYGLTNVNGTMFFQADDGSHGRELWKSDGTPEGTQLVKDVNTGTESSGAAGFTGVGASMFFSAFTSEAGWELWKSDGTTAGTQLVKDINPGAASSGSSGPSKLTNVNGKLFFAANPDFGGPNNHDGLWTSDGTLAGTLEVHTFSNLEVGQFSNVCGTLFFSADDGALGYELWKSDGTPAGTTLVQDIAPGAANASPSGFAIAHGYVFFGANDNSAGAELWALPLRSGPNEPPPPGEVIRVFLPLIAATC
jgi:ELWxxDGT repeat protein